MTTDQNQLAYLPAIIVSYHGGGDMLKELRVRGIPYVRIQATPDISSNKFMAQFLAKEQSDEDVLIYQGDFAQFSGELKSLGVTHIIPADEAGVKFTDRLCEELGLPYNGMEKSSARRNKQLMHQAVSERGLRVPQQKLCDNPDDVSSWMEEHHLKFPIVIKPVDGAGTAGVTRCDSLSDVKNAFSTIKQLALHEGNVISVENQVLSQELLQGTEYVVDTVSLDGHHKVTDIWKCIKGTHNGSAFIYEYFDLLPRDGVTQDALVEYVGGVLESLSISLGPGHSEVYFHEDTGPVLVETAARIGGPRMPFPTAACTASRKSQMEYTVDAYLEPNKFHDEWDSRYEIVRQSRMVFLISKEEGLFKCFAPDLMNQIRLLPSYYAEELAIDPGDQLRKTTDVRSSPGCIFLVHDSKEQLLEDYALIRQIETRLYLNE